MKKAISVILSVIMALSMLTLTAAAADKELNFIVASDIHYAPAPSALGVYNSDPLYSYSQAKGILLPESAAIFDAFLAQAAQSNATAVLISGDIVDVPSAASHSYITAKLSAFEAQTGKQVFVIDGNHDVNGNYGKDAFKAAYAEFGYNEAVAIDPNSCSYAADLGDGYRLIAVDTVNAATGKGVITKDTLDWVKAQYEEALAEKLGVFVMMHHPMLEHIPSQKTFLPDYLVADCDSVASMFAGLGFTFAFTGHFHVTDVASNTVNNKTVYDIGTGSLTSDNCPYRAVKVTDKTISTSIKSITNIDVSAIADLYTPEQYTAITTDFAAYSKGFYKAGVSGILTSQLSTTSLTSKLGIPSGSSAYALVDKVCTTLKNCLNLTMDEFRQAASDAGVTVQTNKYASLNDVIAEYVENVTAGDENINATTTLYKVLYQSVEAVLTIALKDTDNETLTQAMNELAARLPDKIPGEIVSSVINSIANGDRRTVIGSLTKLVFVAVVSDFGVDDLPSDLSNSFVNPFTHEEKAKLQSFWQKIIAFFNRILDFFAGLMSGK